MRTLPVPLIWCIYIFPIILQKIKNAIAEETEIEVCTLSPSHKLKIKGDTSVNKTKAGKHMSPILSNFAAQRFIHAKSLRV